MAEPLPVRISSAEKSIPKRNLILKFSLAAIRLDNILPNTIKRYNLLT